MRNFWPSPWKSERRVEQVEVGLRDLREDGRLLERAVARAEGQAAGAALLDRDPHVLAAGDVGVLRA